MQLGDFFMASFITSNGYNPLVYGYLTQQRAVQSNKIINSGIARTDEYLNQRIAAGGNHFELSNYKALTYDEPSLSDESGTIADKASISSDLQKGRVPYLNKMWAVKDFAKDIVGQNPVTAITSGMGGYWSNAIQKRAIATLIGVMKDNIANDSSDMVLDVSNDNNSAVLATEKISAANILTAKQKKGDKADQLTYLIINSAMYTSLQLQNLITYIPNARGEIMFEKYLNYTLIVDDDSLLIDTSGTYRDKYTCILASAGALGYGFGKTNVPFAAFRDEKTGNGGGEEFFISRMSPVLHPWGFSWLDDTVAGASQNVAELQLADNWDRVWENKNIGLAYLIVNETLKS